MQTFDNEKQFGQAVQGNGQQSGKSRTNDTVNWNKNHVQSHGQNYQKHSQKQYGTIIFGIVCNIAPNFPIKLRPIAYQAAILKIEGS